MACGFFGKLPASGDFLARGLPAGLQSFIDRWLTRYLAEHARTPELWPEPGLRALLPSPSGGSFALLIVPSQDSAGRHFPLAIYADATDADEAQVNLWADQVLPIAHAAIRDTQKADHLLQVLAQCPTPAPAAVPLVPPMLWSDGPPSEPATALHQVFS